MMESSLGLGSTAAACIAEGADLDATGHRKQYNRCYRTAHGGKPRARRLPDPRPGEAMPKSMCLQCGMIGKHRTPADCISALRDRLALWE